MDGSQLSLPYRSGKILRPVQEVFNLQKRLYLINNALQNLAPGFIGNLRSSYQLLFPRSLRYSIRQNCWHRAHVPINPPLLEAAWDRPQVSVSVRIKSYMLAVAVWYHPIITRSKTLKWLTLLISDTNSSATDSLLRLPNPPNSTTFFWILAMSVPSKKDRNYLTVCLINTLTRNQMIETWCQKM
jgi:hypothetical protein